MSAVEVEVLDLMRDRRGKRQLESARHVELEWADLALEKRWRENVAKNIERRGACPLTHKYWSLCI